MMMAYLNKSQKQYVTQRYNTQKSALGEYIKPAIGALGQLGSTWLQGRQQEKNITQTTTANKEMAEYAYQKDLEMWHRQNRYNSPEAQQARLKAAGLNPNLMYGQGTTGEASGMPRYQPPRQEFPNIPKIDPFATLNAYMDTAQKEENLKYTDAQIQVQKAQEAITVAREMGVWNTNTITALEAEISKAILDRHPEGTIKEIAKGRIGGLKAEDWLKKASAEIKQWEAKLTRQNINPRDSVAVRYIVDLLSTIGFSPSQINRNIKGGIERSKSKVKPQTISTYSRSKQ